MPPQPQQNDLLANLTALEPLSLSEFEEPTLEVSLVIPAKNSALTLESTVAEADAYFRRLFSSEPSEPFEIILVPNPAPGDTADRSVAVAEDLARKYPSVRVCRHPGPCGKGAAIRSGVAISRGKWIFFTDADLPYDLSFFGLALQKLKSGYDLVTGNRRLLQSIFHIPVSLLPLAYGRHRLGLGFNRLVRFFLPIETTDTQAGIKAMSRRLAKEAFSRQVCPGFLFDLELFLTARGLGFWQAELAVKLYLNTEKSTVRILRECVLVAFWLTRIFFRNRKGAYGTVKHPQRNLWERYREAPFGTRVFLVLRWFLTPYHQMAAHLPMEGTILDLGCGHGLFALMAALKSPARKMIGIDHDAARIAQGSRAIQDLKNISLSKGTLADLSAEKSTEGSPEKSDETRISGIAIIDVMHYFDPDTQNTVLKQAHQLLSPGGTLIVREVDPQGGVVSSWNRIYEKLATGIGFTQTDVKSKGLFFRTIPGWTDLLESAGFKVRSEPCTSFLFADILYICERT